MPKVTFKNLAYTIVLLGFITLFFTLCSKQIFHPIFNSPPETEKSFIFQKVHESKIKANLENFLEKLIGKKLFVVSVVTTLKDEITNAVSLEKTPQVITNNIKTTIASELNENSITYTKMRPSIEEIRSQLAKPENPAFSIDSLTTSTIELPGFPTRTSIKQNLINSQNDNETTTIEDNTLEPTHELAFQNNTLYENNKIIINKKIITEKQHENSIEQISISVVIDKEFFSYIDISLEELTTMVKNVSGINIERGDTVSVKLAPFLNKGFSWDYFIKKNKIWLDKFISIYEKVKPIIFIVIIILSLIAATLGIKKLSTWYIKQQKERKLKELEQKRKEEEEKNKNKISRLEEKKQALIQLAQSKPEQFILLISSWMEVDQHEKTT